MGGYIGLYECVLITVQDDSLPGELTDVLSSFVKRNRERQHVCNLHEYALLTASMHKSKAHSAIASHVCCKLTD